MRTLLPAPVSRLVITISLSSTVCSAGPGPGLRLARARGRVLLPVKAELGGGLLL